VGGANATLSLRQWIVEADTQLPDGTVINANSAKVTFIVTGWPG